MPFLSTDFLQSFITCQVKCCKRIYCKQKAFNRRSFFERQYLRKLKREDYLKISKRKKLEKYNATGLLTKYYTH